MTASAKRSFQIVVAATKQWGIGKGQRSGRQGGGGVEQAGRGPHLRAPRGRSPTHVRPSPQAAPCPGTCPAT